MANTERMNALKQVAEARKATGEARQVSNLTPKQIQLLDDVYRELMDTEDTLVHEDIQDSIATLNEHSKALGDLTTRLKRSTEKLKKLSNTINTVAKVIGVLADIIAKAASVGLL